MSSKNLYKKLIVTIWLLLLLAVIFLGVLGIVDAKIIFAINMASMIFIIGYCQFSLLSVFAILVNYPSISLYLKYSGITVYGVLDLFSNDFFKEQMIAVLLTNISFILWSVVDNYLECEKKLFSVDISVSKASSIICCVGAILATIIRFPTLDFSFSMDSRFVTLLPGGAWNHVAIIFMIFLWFSKEKVYPKMVVFICLIYFILHYERVDVLGFILMIFLLSFVRKNYRINFRFISKYVMLFAIVFVFFMYIGEVREDYQQNFFSDFFMKILNQKTSSDVGYTYVASFKYAEDFGYANGKTFLYYVYNAVPIMDGTQYDVAIILAQRYGTAYGMYILGEAYINFGWIGLVLLPNLYLWWLKLVIKHRRPYRFILYLYIIASSFRIIWYGISYIETGIIYILPLAYFIVYLFNGRKRDVV